MVKSTHSVLSNRIVISPTAPSYCFRKKQSFVEDLSQNMAQNLPIFCQDNFWISSICIIGFLSLSKTLFKFLKWVYSTFLRPPKKLTSYGSWALITGPTDGIGKALSFDLASQGLNLVLVGRNPRKLQSTSDEIWAKFGKKTHIRIVVIDFEKVGGVEIEEKIRRGTEGLDVGVLVNNVGLCAQDARYFHEVDLGGIERMIRVNVGGVSWVTKGVISGMLRRRKGAIVNVGSGSGSSCALPSYPLFATYAATKGYVAMFSRCLSVEYQQYGIDIQCQMPMLVATKMASIEKTSFFVPSPKQFSKASVRWIGYDTLCIPYWTHAFKCFLLKLLPDSYVNWRMLTRFLNVRKKVLQKESTKSSLK